MKKKITHIVFTVVCMYLIVAGASVNTRAQVRLATVVGKITWKKAMGTIPISESSDKQSPDPCGRYFIAATDGTGKLVKLANKPTLAPDEGDNYVCKYIIGIPYGQKVNIVAGFGDARRLPELDTSSPIYVNAPWIGGTKSKPIQGEMRGFTGGRVVVVKRNPNPRVEPVTVHFEMVYVKINAPK
jgi:hypothetical protein